MPRTGHYRTWVSPEKLFGFVHPLCVGEMSRLEGRRRGVVSSPGNDSSSRPRPSTLDRPCLLLMMMYGISWSCSIKRQIKVHLDSFLFVLDLFVLFTRRMLHTAASVCTRPVPYATANTLAPTCATRSKYTWRCCSWRCCSGVSGKWRRTGNSDYRCTLRFQGDVNKFKPFFSPFLFFSRSLVFFDVAVFGAKTLNLSLSFAVYGTSGRRQEPA